MRLGGCTTKMWKRTSAVMVSRNAWETQPFSGSRLGWDMSEILRAKWKHSIFTANEIETKQRRFSEPVILRPNFDSVTKKKSASPAGHSASEPMVRWSKPRGWLRFSEAPDKVALKTEHSCHNRQGSLYSTCKSQIMCYWFNQNNSDAGCTWVRLCTLAIEALRQWQVLPYIGDTPTSRETFEAAVHGKKHGSSIPCLGVDVSTKKKKNKHRTDRKKKHGSLWASDSTPTPNWYM